MYPAGVYPDEQHPAAESRTAEDVPNDGREESRGRRGHHPQRPPRVPQQRLGGTRTNIRKKVRIIRRSFVYFFGCILLSSSLDIIQI